MHTEQEFVPCGTVKEPDGSLSFMHIEDPGETPGSSALTAEAALGGKPAEERSLSVFLLPLSL